MASTKSSKGAKGTEPKAASKPAAKEASPRKRSAKKGGEKKMSALTAAARVLKDARQAMSCPELITAMAEKGYWKSPGGKTPQATLYSALTREMKTQGNESRFKKAGPGKFASA